MYNVDLTGPAPMPGEAGEDTHESSRYYQLREEVLESRFSKRKREAD